MQAGHDGVDWCALVLNEVCILYIHASTDTLIGSGLGVVGTCYVYMAVDGHHMYFLDIRKYSIAHIYMYTCRRVKLLYLTIAVVTTLI